MADIRVERKKKGIPLIWILLALVVLALVAWALLDRDEPEPNEVTAIPAVVEPWAVLVPAQETTTRSGTHG